MAMIRGIPIILVKNVQVDTDGFNMPIYETVEELVEDVLVSPATSDDISASIDLFGKKAVYTMAIPKGDWHNWEDVHVKFFGQDWRTFGFPIEGIEANIPLKWNKKVMVERYG